MSKKLKFSSSKVKIRELIQNIKDGTYDLNADYQRSDKNWTKEQKQRFITTLLLDNSPIYPLSLFKLTGSNTYEVVDGKQRTSTIFKFITPDNPSRPLKLSESQSELIIEEYKHLFEKLNPKIDEHKKSYQLYRKYLKNEPVELSFDTLPHDLKVEFKYKDLSITIGESYNSDLAWEWYTAINAGSSALKTNDMIAAIITEVSSEIKKRIIHSKDKNNNNKDYLRKILSVTNAKLEDSQRQFLQSFIEILAVFVSNEYLNPRSNKTIDWISKNKYLNNDIKKYINFTELIFDELYTNNISINSILNINGFGITNMKMLFMFIFTLCDREDLNILSYDQKKFKNLMILIFKYIHNSKNVKAENLTPLEMSKISDTYKKISKYRAGGLNGKDAKKMYNDMVDELIEQI